MVKDIIASLYHDRCNVVAYEATKDASTKITKHTEKTIYTDIPCRISFKTINQASGSNTATATTQVVKIFIDPTYTIEPGCKISVTREGVTTDYKNSGAPARYKTHQEIVLELFKGWT